MGGSSDTDFLRLSVAGILRIWQQHLAVELTRSFLNDPAGRAVKILMEAGERGATAAAVGMQLGPALRVDPSDGRPAAFHYLESLARRFAFITRQTVDGGTTVYRVDREALHRELEEEMLAALIASRFGRPSARIARYLMRRGPQEDRFLGEQLLMTAKEIRERCFQLLAVGLAHLQEVPRGIDHVPSRTVFLWSMPLWLIRRQALLRLTELRLALWDETDRADAAGLMAMSTAEGMAARDQLLARSNALTLDSMLLELSLLLKS